MGVSGLVPREAEEQSALFSWAQLMYNKYPELELMYHIPNGGKRSKVEAARLKAQGVKAGVPDICLPVARGGYHGLYIELKRVQGGRASAGQKEWIPKLQRQGYLAVICRGWSAAANVIIEYMKGA